MSKHHDKHKHRHHPRKASESAPAENEGEGSRTADKSYTDHLRTFIDDKRVEPAAKEAKQFVEEHPGEASSAEEKAKAGPMPILKRVGELVSEGRAMWSRASQRVRGMIRRRIRRHA